MSVYRTVLFAAIAASIFAAACGETQNMNADSPSVAAIDTGAAPLEPVYFRRYAVRGFWKDQSKRLAEKWIPHCIEQMEKGGRGQELLNLVHTARVLAGEPAGTFTGRPWSDAYVYNTVESICLALGIDPDGDAELAAAQQFLRKKLAEWIPIILAAQTDDGYIHSYHTVNRRKRFTDINKHEFYVQGYFIEMGVAHYRVTGGQDRRLYDAARRCADLLCRTFGPPPKRNWVHGHAGMGYALCRLARLVNDVKRDGAGDRYYELAKYLFDHRHAVEKHRGPYQQSHRPVVAMEHAVGHAVRATYFYTAMADLAMLTGDRAYRAAVDRIWDSAINRRYYITGGVGATSHGEAFADDYTLPNHSAYCESCAGCGLSFWADRMHRMHATGRCRDVQERVLYNNILGAIELSGENFFYQNPLASDRGRYPWHGCPCCVGNIPRALLDIVNQAYALNAKRDILQVNHFVAGAGEIGNVGGADLRIIQETGYPWKGDVSIALHPAKPARFALRVRIPDRAASALYTAKPEAGDRVTIAVNGRAADVAIADGYATLARQWQPGDRVTVALPMPVQRVYADGRVAADRGRVALQRGPLVYSVEQVDHDKDVRDIVLKPEAALTAAWREDLLGGVMVITGGGLTAIPHFARLNRGGWSQVWIVEDPEQAVPRGPQPVVRKELDARTVDRVLVGVRKSEKAHGLNGEKTSSGIFRDRRWRHATGGGRFSYDLAIDPDARNLVLVTYWGGETGDRRFDILADDAVIGSQKLLNNRPGEFFDVTYPLPKKLTAGKKKITVTLRAEPGALAGGIFDLRIVRPGEQ